MLIAPLLLAVATAVSAPEDVYEEDVAFALDALEETCGHFFKAKGVDWKKVRKEFKKAAKEIDNDLDQRVLLVRLIARIKDGHAYVKVVGEDPGWPEELMEPKTGPGFFLCKIGKKYYVKTAFRSAEQVGLKPGMEVLKIDGVATPRWIEARMEEVADMESFSTGQHALFFTLHHGLRGPVGKRIKLEVKTPRGKKSKKTVTYDKASTRPFGPAFLPQGAETLESGLSIATLESGVGYIHLPRVRAEIPESMDEALARLGNPPGLILDFRGNSGGGCDHDALFGRFVPQGEEMQRASAGPIPSAGPNPYGGPIVTIVDGTVISAGETTSGMFKEDGRGYMIGESRTAGMSSQKTTIDLPSKRFALYVSTRSNKGRFNGGKGIEGVGIIPHEIVAYDPEDLAAGRDTLTAYAEAVFLKWPKGKVPYDPRRYGWER